MFDGSDGFDVVECHAACGFIPVVELVRREFGVQGSDKIVPHLLEFFLVTAHDTVQPMSNPWIVRS